MGRKLVFRLLQWCVFHRQMNAKYLPDISDSVKSLVIALNDASHVAIYIEKSYKLGN